jgi:hypothetical protein
MAIDVFSQTSTTLTSGAALQLGADITTPGVYQLMLDLTNMASGDSLTVTIYGSVIGGGAFRLMDSTTFIGAQSIPVAALPIVFPFEGQVFIQQTAGTLREYDWSITRLDA